MSNVDLVRLEFSMRREDAELFKRMAERRGSTVSELVRQAIYAQYTPLHNAQAERDELAMREVAERRKLADWNGQRERL